MDSKATIVDGRVDGAEDVSGKRLKELLDYVEQVIKLDERPVFKLSEYRLGSGQTFVFHQHEFHSLPGITHDLTDDDGPVWLSAERLKRTDPPKPSDALAPWLELSPDPERTPLTRDHLLMTVSKPECDELVSSGRARADDCAPSMSADAAGLFDVRFRLEDRPEIAEEAEQYLSSSWLPWSVGERPRRRSIALYQKLFEVLQLSELGGAEQAIELVWGIGVSRWIKDGAVIDLPLVERLVEIEIDERAAGIIRIRPRQAQATANLRPYDELKIEGAPIAQDAARRAIANAEGDLGVSPFQPETFEAVLRACQTRLDPEGTYLPDSQTIDASLPLPAPSSNLVVSNRWVFLARKRSDNFLLQDLANLKVSIERSHDDLPGPSRTLVMGPEQTATAGWKPLSASMGVAAPGAESETDAGPLGELFFPKAFNSEQVEIVRRLEANDGVVVQGPPGTGKTHTISNIICHYLAHGRRVLVVSHGEAALSVLRDQLPEEVRDLAISITTSEKEGFKQLEGAVRLLQSIVESLRPNEQLRLIADLERSIIAMRDRIRDIDTEIEGLARAQLSAVPGQKIRPAELAAAVVAERGKYEWFDDRPPVFSAASTISDEMIARARDARIALGARIEHFQARLPSVADLPGGRVLAHLHADILRADALHAQAASETSVVLRINSDEALQQADRAADALDILVDACRHLDRYPFLRPLCVAIHSARDAPFRSALQAFLSESAGILADHKKFLQTPVAVPEEVVSSREIFETVSRLAAGEKVFGVFSFKEKQLKPTIDAIRVLSQPPATAAEWTYVRDYLTWRKRFLDAQLRWQGLAVELGAETIGLGTLRQLSELSTALNEVLLAAPGIYADVNGALRKIAVGETTSFWPDEQRMRLIRTSLRNATAAVRLAAGREQVTRLSGLFGSGTGKLGGLAKSFLTEVVGRGDIAEGRIEETWTRLLEAVADLARHRGHFEALKSGADDVEAAGAPEWAKRLRSQVALDGQDMQTPADWRHAWDWAAAQKYLSDLDRRQHIKSLAEERLKLDSGVSKGFEQVVRERTFYALANSMTGPVRAALMMFATALRKIGKGTGKGALRHRRDARKAMAACYDGVPCWIMPSWRVAEQLPGELGTFDLVIMDEASQSDIKEVTALLRGRKILVVGDDKQVSPTAAFIDNARIDRLERTFLANQPFKTLLLPGASLYDLAKVMFPDNSSCFGSISGVSSRSSSSRPSFIPKR